MHPVLQLLRETPGRGAQKELWGLVQKGVLEQRTNNPAMCEVGRARTRSAAGGGALWTRFTMRQNFTQDQLVTAIKLQLQMSVGQAALAGPEDKCRLCRKVLERDNTGELLRHCCKKTAGEFNGVHSSLQRELTALTQPVSDQVQNEQLITIGEEGKPGMKMDLVVDMLGRKRAVDVVIKRPDTKTAMRVHAPDRNGYMAHLADQEKGDKYAAEVNRQDMDLIAFALELGGTMHPNARAFCNLIAKAWKFKTPWVALAHLKSMVRRRVSIALMKGRVFAERGILDTVKRSMDQKMDRLYAQQGPATQAQRLQRQQEEERMMQDAWWSRSTPASKQATCITQVLESMLEQAQAEEELEGGQG